MMLVRNSPGRKNLRRIRALERLGAYPDPSERELRKGRTTDDVRRRETAELNTLTLRVRPIEQANAVRTKKDRSGQGKFSRMSS